MTQLQHPVDAPPPGAVALFRRRVPALVERVVHRIQTDVDRYAGPVKGNRNRLITLAVGSAVKHFLEMVEHGPRPAPGVDDLFRQMGHGEATAGLDLSAMRTALRLAARDAWDDLRAFAQEEQLSATALGDLGHALFAYVEHLAEQAAIGHDRGRAARESDSGNARARLLAALLQRAPRETIRAHAATAVWPLPAELVVVCVEDAPDAGRVDLTGLEGSALVAVGTSPLVVVADADRRDEVVGRIQHEVPDARVARSWPVPPAEVPDARRWTERALRLAASGIIPDTAVIDCAEHRTSLWLHAEPALRRHLCQDLLRPLLAETPNSREILSETLLAWLESRDSAPAIAARLGVHPQTVRYRWKRINELFGEDLHDPEFVVQMTMLLKASVPLWKAGDQSDFERYRAGEERA